ncbi:GNAT family N-acetyltransferase [Quadrisphaera setariae]|uniref:GNAT family N-acetyltransferase n=1 Tax=Quadrisphaera setariae TaxID=2593304 RepID=UPI00164F1EAA|nr:GNAT family N-acetyltransferase [Quadrisphaera setariae]
MTPEQDDDGELDVRPLQPDDVDFLRGLARDPRVVRYVGDGRPWSEPQLQERVREALPCSAVRWFVPRDRAGNRVGLLSLRQRAPGRVEVGYWVAPDHWGRGHAGRLLRRGVEVCRGEGVTTVVARVLPGNAASHRVLLRGGFVEAEHQDDPELVLYEHQL